MWQRLQLDSPLRQRRLGELFAVLAAAVAAGSSYLSSGDSERNWTALLDVLAIALACAAVFLEVKSASVFFDFTPLPAKRRALILTVIGWTIGLLACSWSAWGSDSNAAWVSSLRAAALTLGFCIALAGTISLVLYYGAGYAADRIEKLIDEDV